MPDQDTDELYKVPLSEFVRVRDAIAARRKAAGDKDGAAEVRRARKPSLPAWAANQVVRNAPSEWERLRAAAAALRKGHEKGTSPDAIRQASREQREALQACESRAAGFLVASGHAATPAVVQKASGTLQALAYGAVDAEPGRVLEELSPPGFEVLAGMSLPAGGRAPAAPPAPAPDGPPPPAAGPKASVSSIAEGVRRRDEQSRDQEREERVVREEERARRRAAVEAAETRLAEGRRVLAAARKQVDEHEQRLAALEREIEAERRAADGARRAVGAAEAGAAAAEAALEALRADDAGGRSSR